MRFRVQGLGFRIKDSWLSGQGSGVRSGFKVYGL